MSTITSNNNNFIVLSGKDNLYILRTESDSLQLSSTLNLTQIRPVNTSGPKEETPADKTSLVCVTIAADSAYICASDSEKNVFVFKRTDEDSWTPLTKFTTEKRLLKAQFTKKSTHIVMTDKCGDVYIRDLTAGENSEIKPRKILGHCSVILYTCINGSNTEIYTSDRDEKIRVSSFPDSYNINGYYLGHKEAVLFIALVQSDTHLMSFDIESNLKFWNVKNKSCAITFSLFNLLGLSPQSDDVDYQIRLVRVTEMDKRVYIAIRTSFYDKLSVFDFDLESLTVQLVGEVPLETTEFDSCWVNNVLYIVSPDIDQGIGRVSVSQGGHLDELSYVSLNDFANIIQDVRSFVQLNEVTNIPLRKRVGYDGGEKGPANKVIVNEANVPTNANTPTKTAS